MRGSLDRSRIALGGITIGSTKAAVRHIYGEPTSVEKNGWLYRYGSSFRIKFIPGSELGMADDGAYTIVTTANNGIATPDGVTVGMAPKVLDDVYGPADRVNDNRDGSTDYEYWDKDYHATVLCFRVRDDVIRSIICYYYL